MPRQSRWSAGAFRAILGLQREEVADSFNVKINESLRALCGLKEGNILAVIHKEVLGQDSGTAGVTYDVEVLLDIRISVGKVGPQPMAR